MWYLFATLYSFSCSLSVSGLCLDRAEQNSDRTDRLAAGGPGKPKRNYMIPLERWKNLQECIRDDDDLVDNVTEVVPIRLVFVPSPANPRRE